MSDWPKYESHKVVQAAKIVWVGKSAPDGAKIVISVEAVEDGPREYFEPTVPEMAQKAEVGGYAMLYPDGFKSISPAKAFEEGYTPVAS
jgi:hypothetical protein